MKAGWPSINSCFNFNLLKKVNEEIIQSTNYTNFIKLHNLLINMTICLNSDTDKLDLEKCHIL